MDFVMATERLTARLSHPHPTPPVRGVTDRVERAARVRLTAAGQPAR